MGWAHDVLGYVICREVAEFMREQEGQGATCNFSPLPLLCLGQR